CSLSNLYLKLPPPVLTVVIRLTKCCSQVCTLLDLFLRSLISLLRLVEQLLDFLACSTELGFELLNFDMELTEFHLNLSWCRIARYWHARTVTFGLLGKFYEVSFHVLNLFVLLFALGFLGFSFFLPVKKFSVILVH